MGPCQVQSLNRLEPEAGRTDSRPVLGIETGVRGKAGDGKRSACTCLRAL